MLLSCALSTQTGQLPSHRYFLRGIKLNKRQINNTKHDFMLSCSCFSRLKHCSSSLTYKYHLALTFPFQLLLFPAFTLSPSATSIAYTLPQPRPWDPGSQGHQATERILVKFTSKLPYLVLQSLTLSVCGFCCQCWLCLIIFSAQISSTCSLQSEADIFPG